jgi:hypothetical protein
MYFRVCACTVCVCNISVYFHVYTRTFSVEDLSDLLWLLSRLGGGGGGVSRRPPVYCTYAWMHNTSGKRGNCMHILHIIAGLTLQLCKDIACKSIAK